MQAREDEEGASLIWGRFEEKLSNKELRFYLNALSEFTGQKESSSAPRIFPGPSPVSTDALEISSKDMSPYFVSLKADGERSLLFITKDADGVPIALLVNRHLQMVEVSAEVDSSLFVGTILDGELVVPVNSPHTTCFLAFDTPLYSGRDMRRRPLQERYALLLTTSVSFGVPMSFQIKEYATISNLPALWAKRFSEAYASDGVIFTHGESPYIRGTDMTLFKWKQTHTVDVEAHSTGEVVVGVGTPLHLHRQKLMLEGTSYVCALLVPDDINERLQKQKRIIVECTCELLESSRMLLLVAIKERIDKSRPNGLRTFISTISHVKSASAFDDICRALGLLRANAAEGGDTAPPTRREHKRARKGSSRRRPRRRNGDTAARPTSVASGDRDGSG